MIPRRLWLSTATFALLAWPLAAPDGARAREPVRVIATFSLLGDMVESVGGERVSVTALVGPNGDAHVYQPTPAAARLLGEADLLVVNGLDFEGWLDRLIDASGFDGARVVASAAIEPLGVEERRGDDHAGEEDAEEEARDGHRHGAFDPHAWQSLDNAIAYVDAIAAGLAEADPDNATFFYRNRAAYVAEIEALDAEIRAMIESLPEDRRTVVTSHDAFRYFGRDYGLTFLAPQGISTESGASAQDVAGLIERIREEDIAAVFLENAADGRLLERIAAETDAAIGGVLYPGALSDPDGPAPSYLELMRHNATTLARALSP